ncbi:MAG: hypothetical protein M3Z32_06070, partial [Acidobacteriota bacterium]|nr:hypothetical protein [Acidobacteriota bacterium]
PFQVGRFRFSPFGFFESTGVYRSTASGDDMSTRFGAIPLQSSPRENLVSFRNSRMALLGETTLASVKLSGYVETDFLNRPPAQPFRFRQYFGKFEAGNWEIYAGQAWSLLRPSRAGFSTTVALMNTRVVDAGYHVGLLGFRDRQIRIVRHLGSWHAALSVEHGKDVLPKITRDTKRAHWEATGLFGARGRRGLSLAGVLHASPKVDLVTQQFFSKGGGPDALSTIPAGVVMYSTLEGVEAKVARGLQVFTYGGFVRGQRSAGNRAVGEWTVGFTKDVVKDRYGLAVFSSQYSEVARATWDGRQGAMKFAMISMRHYFGVQ